MKTIPFEEAKSFVKHTKKTSALFFLGTKKAIAHG